MRETSARVKSAKSGIDVEWAHVQKPGCLLGDPYNHCPGGRRCMKAETESSKPDTRPLPACHAGRPGYLQPYSRDPAAVSYRQAGIRHNNITGEYPVRDMVDKVLDQYTRRPATSTAGICASWTCCRKSLSQFHGSWADLYYAYNQPAYEQLFKTHGDAQPDKLVSHMSQDVPQPSPSVPVHLPCSQLYVLPAPSKLPN